MADLSITAANVSGNAGALRLAGVAITAGNVVYISTNNTYALAQANTTGTGSAAVAGISLVSASPGQPVILQSAGSLNPGATVAKGQTYILSTNAGKIAVISDLPSGRSLSYIGYATATNSITLSINNTGVIKA